MPRLEELQACGVFNIDPIEEFLNLERWPWSPLNGGGDDDGFDGYDDVDDFSPHEWQASHDLFMVGFVMVNVVGLRHYNGTINGREMVSLVREPLNQFDGNAIKVLNIRCVQLGYIEARAAAVLAPLIDSCLITVEGIVPKLPGGTFRERTKMPCRIHIFARIEAFGQVKSALETGDLQLHSESNLSEASLFLEKRNHQDEKTLDEVFKLLDERIAEKGKLDELEPPKDVIRSELLMHQKEGLGWLVHRENSLELPPFWEEKDGEYINALTNCITSQRPEPLRGGIFADDMGLGKTLTLLSLIAFDKFFGDSPSIANNVDVAKDWVTDDKRGKRFRSERGSPNSNKAQKRPKCDVVSVSKGKGKSICNVDRHYSLVSKATLIVCPLSVLSAWLTQLEDHTVRGRLKTYLYHGERTGDPYKLKEYDIVLTTYSTLATEDACPESPVKKIEWHRVILDEAHVIKNVNALQSRAVNKLNSKRRWVVTGTPIQNHSFDLFSLMAFLRFEPLSIKGFWTNLIARPLGLGDEKGIRRLQVLMASISLRRTKEKALVGLTSKKVETYFVDLSVEERDVYDKMEAEAKKVISQYISSGKVIRNYPSVLSILLRIRQVCNDLSLCPLEIKELLPTLEDVNTNPKLLGKMLSVLQEGEEFDCPICISPPSNAVITCCAHIFCQACILKSIRQSKPCCPLCRHPLSDSDLFVSPPKVSETEIGVSSSSSKVKGLLKLLSAARQQNGNSKSVIFSQFRKMLLLLEEPLKAAGFKVLRLDGTMSAKKRGELIKKFGIPAPDGPTVLLASLKACGAGINLTAASTVYLLEPWWNPAIEEQAMDRVHRIGQKEDVKVVRMIARNTVEERILELQENKKLLARKAFGRKGGSQDHREISQDDLITLMKL